MTRKITQPNLNTFRTSRTFQSEIDFKGVKNEKNNFNDLLEWSLNFQMI